MTSSITTHRKERKNEKLLLVVIFVLAATVGYAQDAYIELLRSDIKAKKVAMRSTSAG